MAINVAINGSQKSEIFGTIMANNIKHSNLTRFIQ